MNNRNEFFQLINKEDGLYLKIYPLTGNGSKLTIDEITKYLSTINITIYDQIELNNVLMKINEPTEFKLNNTRIYPENEKINILIAEDKRTAIGRFYPPSNDGKQLTKEDIIDYLVKCGIKYGVVHENIDSFLTNRRYCTDILLAKALEPVNGKNAIITYYFKTDTTSKPKTNEDGSVDFHQLDLISHVNKGDLLATLTPADFGKSGIDVCGREIKPLKVQNKVLKFGRNIHLSEDGLKMYADVSGHVSLTDDKVFVSDTYEIIADVDSSTGDINYEGNVRVKGNVLTGFSIKARGDIEVNGVVEGATLIAGGQIILKRGIQGMNKGSLSAGGNIVSKFIENSIVKAGGYITTEAIMHSNVSAKGDITIGGKKGSVTGGEIRSSTMISAKTAGSMMGTYTLLEVGSDPNIIEEYHSIEKEIASMKVENEKLKQIITLLRKKKDAGEDLSAVKLEQLKNAIRNYILLETKIKDARQRRLQLSNEMDNKINARIKIQNVVYPGVKIVISNVIYFVRNEQKYCQFIRDEADIRVIEY